MDSTPGMDHGNRPTGGVTNYVVLGTLNWRHDRKRHAKAVETYERLDQSAGFETLHAAEKDVRRAVEPFETYEGLSFGDTTVAAYMTPEGIEYPHGFDDDFDTLDGITRLGTADNPVTRVLSPGWVPAT